jgi:flagellar protein FliJ
MVKPFALQTVLDLMQERTDEATQQLARLIANERDANNKLALLQQYRDEYAERFRLAGQKGLTQGEWHNYREFLNRLDEAIDTQRQMVRVQAQKTQAGQVHWQQQRQKLEAFHTLSDRHFASQESAKHRREQKTQDEFSARAKDRKESQ